MQKLIIHSERLLIRNLCDSDLKSFHLYRSNPEITRYQGFDVFDVGQAKDFIAGQRDKEFGHAGEWVQYAIELRDEQRLIGDCAIKLHEDVRIASVGITISHREHQNGYATETMNAILKFLFEELKIHRVEEIVDVENEASIKLLERVGFKREAHFVENVFFKGAWGSEYQYAMLRSEWPGSK